MRSIGSKSIDPDEEYIINVVEMSVTPIQENFIYKKQGPSPISMVRATRIFSKVKTLKKKFDLSLAIGDNPIYPF
jgi:hypothetical protein